MALSNGKKKSKHPLRTKTKRTTAMFQLDWTKDRERRVGNAIDDLKKSRKFKEACLVGIEQFAGIIDAPTIEVTAIATPQPVIDTTAIDAQQKQLDREWALLERSQADFDRERQLFQLERDKERLAIAQQRAELERLINVAKEAGQGERVTAKASNTGFASETRISAQHGNAQVIDVPQFSAPSFDDDDDGIELVVRKDETAGQRANQNFLASMSALLNDGNDYTKPVETVTEGNARKLDAPSFDAPSWDDDDDDLF